MDKGTALTLLGLNDSIEQEEIMERLDAEAFAVRDHFMRQPVIPTLFRSRVNRLVELSDVGRVLGIKPLGAPVDLPNLLPTGENFVLLVRNHVENIRRLRTAMAGTLDPDVLVRFGNTLCNLQLRYMEQFLVLSLDVSGSAIHEEAVPAREEAEWQALLNSIESNEPWAESLIARERARMAQILEREVS
jgi:hypothetical protein